MDYQKNNKARIKPKIIQLRPAECPCYQTCVIRNALKRKENGGKYAKNKTNVLRMHYKEVLYYAYR